MMPNPFSIDLRWRAVWLYIAQRCSTTDIFQLLQISDHSVRRYVQRFYLTGDVSPSIRRNGPGHLFEEFEQLLLLRLIIQNPGIYLHEIQNKIFHHTGVLVSSSTICRTLKSMGCSRQCKHFVAIQQCPILRARFMAEISMYDPSMLIWIDETGCDRRNTIRKYAYGVRGIPLCDHRLLI